MTTLLKLPSVMNATGLSRATVYLRCKQGLLTSPVKLGLRAVAWPANEVDSINKAWIAGKSLADIRALVVDLEKRRATIA